MNNTWMSYLDTWDTTHLSISSLNPGCHGKNCDWFKVQWAKVQGRVEGTMYFCKQESSINAPWSASHASANGSLLLSRHLDNHQVKKTSCILCLCNSTHICICNHIYTHRYTYMKWCLYWLVIGLIYKYTELMGISIHL
jgi:hypothetical protein